MTKKEMMNKMMIRFMVVLLLVMAAAQPSYCQYLNKLYDFDSTYNWGWDILNKADGNYFIVGWSYSETTGLYSIFNTTISGDGNNVLTEKRFTNNSGTIGNGNNPGQIQPLANGGYILPLILQWPNAAYTSSAAGLMKLNAAGDTVFFKTYTDTTISFYLMNACAVMPDGGYIGGGGGQSLVIPSTYPCYLARTDSMGDTLWTHTYQKDPSQTATVNTIAPLTGGRILVGATSTAEVSVGTNTVDINAPWFMVLDSMGNILRDTLYDWGIYAGGGYIYEDRNGGYFHVGSFDSLVTSNPSDYQNYPGYIAHLDTNFRIEWIREFPYNDQEGHRYCFKALQLQDGNFLLEGDIGTNAYPFSLGWAAKVSRSGTIMWNNYYLSDSVHNAYFRDAAEKPDGSIVFIGATFNDTLPAWRQVQDVWLVGVDSNGCMVEGCGETGIASPRPSPKEREVLRVWPNPTYGDFSVKATDGGELSVYNVQGQMVAGYKVSAGETGLRLPAGLSAGVYMCRYVGDGGSAVVVRLVYEP